MRKKGVQCFMDSVLKKGIWEFGRLELEQLFSIEKLAPYGEVRIAECFLVGLSYDGQELEQGESGGVGKSFCCWVDLYLESLGIFDIINTLSCFLKEIE